MHTFRKYISNRGSALFMVISTMTALMITCMAMYFTVLASRSTIYAVFNQKQSYQNSSSIYDMVVNNGLSPTSDLYKQMEKMAVGETLTTPPTEDEYLGTYTVTITKLSENEYDIVVSSTVDGVTETVHNVISITNSVEEVPMDGSPSVSIAPTFAATGYVPNDVYLDRGFFVTDIFFDNEVTYFGAYEADNLFTGGDINCSGSVVFKESFYWNSQDTRVYPSGLKPITFSIRNNFTFQGQNLTAYEGSRIYVGGNCYALRNMKGFDVYVNGDLYIGADNQDCKFFVNGNVYIQNGNIGNNIYCNGKIYDNAGNDVSSRAAGKWDYTDSTTGAHEGVAGPGDTPGNLNGKKILSYDVMLRDLDNRTQTNTYYKWTVDDKEVSMNGSLNEKTIEVTSFNKPVEIVYGSPEWGTGCVLKDITINPNAYASAFIIIDTGDNPDNVYTMRLKANRTYNGVKNVFSWTGEAGDNARAIVLVKGRGSVVLQVDKDVIYQDTDNSILAHYNWFMLGEVGKARQPEKYQSSGEGNSSIHISPDNMKKYVLTNCSSCNNGNTCTETDSEEKCSREVLKAAPGGGTYTAICGETKKTVTCSKHNISVTYCPKCEQAFVKDADGKWIICKNHVDTAAIQNVYNNAPNNGYAAKEEWNRDSSGNLIYPTTNIFLVSSEESATFNFGVKLDGQTILKKNSMIGYVYAPYVSFFAKGGDTGDDAIKYMGGMTVSDYKFGSQQTFIMCVPDKNPTDLMDEDDLKQKFKVSKDWKIDLVTH